MPQVALNPLQLAPADLPLWELTDAGSVTQGLTPWQPQSVLKTES